MGPSADPRGDGERPIRARALSSTPRWVVAALLLSVGANLAVGGVAAGRWMREMGEDRSLGRFERRMLAMVPEARRAEAREILTAESEGDRAAFVGRMMGATERVAEALRAEPFDPQAFRTALSARLEVFRERFGARHDRLVGIAEMLEVEERRRMATAFTERVRRRFVERSAR